MLCCNTNCKKKTIDKCLDCKKCIILKYVRTDVTDFFFFPIHINHSKILSISKDIISAGFFNLTKMETFGESISLGKRPKKDDIEIIKVILDTK